MERRLNHWRQQPVVEAFQDRTKRDQLFLMHFSYRGCSHVLHPINPMLRRHPKQVLIERFTDPATGFIDVHNQALNVRPHLMRGTQTALLQIGCADSRDAAWHVAEVLFEASGALHRWLVGHLNGHRLVFVLLLQLNAVPQRVHART